MNKQNTCGHETARSYRNGRVRCLGCGKRMTMAQWYAVIDTAEKEQEAARVAAEKAPKTIGQQIRAALGMTV